MRVEDFDYELPERLIAQSPLDRRDDSRLLVVHPHRYRPAALAEKLPETVDSPWEHSVFRQLPQFLEPGDVLVLNDSRVIPARLYGRKAETGGRVEVLLTQALTDVEWLALTRPAKRLQVGTVVEFTDRSGQVAGWAEVLEVLDEGLRRLRFHLAEDYANTQDGAGADRAAGGSDGRHSAHNHGSVGGHWMEDFLNRFGAMPLPPYIHQPLADATRYQTVYAEPPGSVAAPTAGLHFTPQLLTEIGAMGVDIQRVTLHVGIGTFRPVSVDNVEDHVMHREVYSVSPETANAVNRAHSEGRRVVAVGTTALRTLESAAATGQVVPGTGETGIFIYPGYRFRATDALITNFHLPRSTLLMLVSAFMGQELTMATYRLAVNEEYRFFSFGDAMFIANRGELA